MNKSYPGTPTNPPTFDVEFDYSVWTPDTVVQLVNVPWDNSYRDVVRFETEDDRSAYFAGLSAAGYSITLTGMVYLRYGEPIRINVPFSAANKCNYIIVKNPQQPIPSHGGVRNSDTFYYFINDVRYLSPNTTELTIQLDVWQSYYNRVSFDMCYVERGHIGIANENSTIENLADYLTEPEGLEIGNEYEITNNQWHGFQTSDSKILILSTADLSVDLGNINEPNLETASGDAIDGLISGCNGYLVEARYFDEVMRSLAVYPWASQCIILIVAMPADFARPGEATKIAGVGCNKIYPDHPSLYALWEFANIYSGFNIPNRYSELLKFYTSPYSTFELTNFNGAPIIIKPEMLEYVNATLTIKTIGTALPTGARFYACPLRVNGVDSVQFSYKTLSGANGNPTLNNATIDGGEYLDCALVFDNFPQFSVVNNSYMTYLASTANTRAYQYQSADWSQQKALTAAQNAYDISNAGVNTSLQNTAAGIGAAWQSNDIANQRAMVGAASGVIGGAANAAGGNVLGGIGQAASAAANGALSVNWNNQQTQISTSLSATQARNNANLANYTADTNLAYANAAAKGDYAMAIAGIQAKVDDARLTQPSVSGQNGGQAANYACGLMGVLLRNKRLKGHFLNQIGEYWLRYGYAINRFITPPENLKCMTKVTYWKMQNVMIRALIPEVHKQAIRGIFETGVSVWNNPAEINNIDLGENKTIKGIRY